MHHSGTYIRHIQNKERLDSNARFDGKFLIAAANDADDESSLSPCFASPVEALAAAGRAKRERKDAVRTVLSFMFAIQFVQMFVL